MQNTTLFCIILALVGFLSWGIHVIWFLKTYKVDDTFYPRVGKHTLIAAALMFITGLAVLGYVISEDVDFSPEHPLLKSPKLILVEFFQQQFKE